MTNSDWLRGVSDDELTDFICKITDKREPLFKLWLNQDRRIVVHPEYVYKYPVNAIYEILDGDQRLPVQFSGDQINGFWKALSMITERERHAIELRFERLYTLEQIGAYFKVTKERALQILRKAIRKMRHPSSAKLILLGLSECTRIAEQKELNERVFTDKFNVDESIDTLDLSVRAHNCLARSGVRTWFDVSLLSDEAIINIPHCGVHTAREIRNRRDMILKRLSEVAINGNPSL